MMKDGAGPGEGVVVKNFLWVNQYGCQPWAKLVRNDFKEANREEFGTNKLRGAKFVEKLIADTAVTKALVDKERAKIEQHTTDRKVIIPRLLETVFYCLVTEELWDALKKHGKNSTVNFKVLRSHCIMKIKEHAEDLF
jgi:hypothetical protein